MAATKESVHAQLVQRASSAISALQSLHEEKEYAHAFIVEGSLKCFKEERKSQLGIKLDDKYGISRTYIQKSHIDDDEDNRYYTLRFEFDRTKNADENMRKILQLLTNMATTRDVDNKKKIICLRDLTPKGIQEKLIYLGYTDEMLIPLAEAMKNELEFYNLTQTQRDSQLASQGSQNNHQLPSLSPRLSPATQPLSQGSVYNLPPSPTYEDDNEATPARSSSATRHSQN